MFRMASNVIAGVAGAVVICSIQELKAKDLVACHDCHMKRLPKAKELPFYEMSEDFIVEHDDVAKLPFISEVSSIRQQFTKYASYFEVAIKETFHVYETGVAHSKTAYEHLKDEENKLPRAIAIASGGLVGLLCARKGGIVKKILLASAGTGAAFTVFYPTLSKKYVLSATEFMKHNVDTVLSKYGGYDTRKMADEANAKFNYLIKTMKLESILEKMRELFHKNKDVHMKKPIPAVEDGNSSDQDLYTTRTNA